MKELEILRKTGKRLYKEMPEVIRRFSSGDYLRVGASGDKTYPIDQKAEEIVFGELERYFFEEGRFTAISEEYGFKDFGDSMKKFLIDPIDGSSNARKGIPFYSTSVALVEGEKLNDTKIGYVINLVNGNEFWAIKGEGAFIFDNLSGRTEKLRTSDDTNIGLILYEASSPSRDITSIIPLLRKAHRTRCLGSTALDLCYLAKGACSIFIIPFPSRSFDYAAGWMILKEAGGIITDLEGNDIGETAVGIERTVSILASSNTGIHNKAIEIIRREFGR